MTTPADQLLSPDTLETYFRSGTATTHRVNDSPEIHITIDGPGQKVSILTPRNGMVLDTAQLRRVTTGIDVRGGVEWVRLTLDARGMYAEAYGLAISMVQTMRGGATFAAASSAAMTNMKALLANRPQISEEKQIGLFGELLLFCSSWTPSTSSRSSTGGSGHWRRNAIMPSPHSTPRSRPRSANHARM